MMNRTEVLRRLLLALGFAAAFGGVHAQSIKERMEKQLAPSSGKTGAKAILERELGASSDPVPFSSDNGACPYLTRPLVRADGGGLNRHAGGSVVCHQGKALHCLGSRWQDRGPCSAYGKIPQAYEIEGTEPTGEPPEPPDEDGGPEGGGKGRGRNNNDEGPGNAGGRNNGGGSSFAGGGLLGKSAKQRDLEHMQEQVEQTQQQYGGGQGGLAGRGAGVGRTDGNGAAAGGAAAPNPAECADGQRTLQAANAQIATIEEMSRKTMNGDGINPRYQEGYHTLVAIRQQIQDKLRQMGCN